MALELKLVESREGLRCYLPDSAGQAVQGTYRLQMMWALTLAFCLAWGLGTLGLYQLGLALDPGAMVAFVAFLVPYGLLMRFPMKAGWGLSIGHAGLTKTRVYGTVRMAQLVAGTAVRRPHRLASDVPEVTLPWTDLAAVRWNEVSVEVVERSGVVHSFDLEDYPRADIERLGRSIHDTWQRYVGAAETEEGTEQARAQLAALSERAQGSTGE